MQSTHTSVTTITRMTCILLYLIFDYFLHTYIAVCPTGCFNGGNCTSPGMCTCTPQWTGNNCTQGMKIFNDRLVTSYVHPQQ